MLTLQNWKTMLEKQKDLDKIIQEKRKIRYVPMHVKKLSFNQEIAEFIQEVKEDWCYWKNSTTQLEAMLEEVADILCFGASIANQARNEAELTHEVLTRTYKNNLRSLQNGSKKLDRILYQISSDPGTSDRVGKILAYLAYNGITADQVVTAHEAKVAKNLARQEAGY